MLFTKATVTSLQDLQRSERFNELWEETEEMAQNEGCDVAMIPRKRTISKKFGGGHKDGIGKL